MPARIGVGEGGDDERGGMGGHVQAVGNQRHGTPEHPANNFGGHHRDAEHHDSPAAPLVSVVVSPEEYVFVSPLVDRMGVHGFLASLSILGKGRAARRQ